MAANNDILTRIENDIKALNEMVGQLFVQSTDGRLLTQVKFRGNQQAYRNPISIIRGIRG